jgi:hypothetical protein
MQNQSELKVEEEDPMQNQSELKVEDPMQNQSESKMEEEDPIQSELKVEALVVNPDKSFEAKKNVHAPQISYGINQNIASTCHAIVSCFCAALFLFLGKYQTVSIAITTVYFVFDFFCFKMHDRLMILHHLMGIFFGLIIFYDPYYTNHYLLGLLTEASTPFLNWYLDARMMNNSKLALFYWRLFYYFFLVFRIFLCTLIILPYAIYSAYVREEGAGYTDYSLIFVFHLLTLMNWGWFFGIKRKLKKIEVEYANDALKKDQ